jgi:histidinol phosphatase-like enzyme
MGATSEKYDCSGDAAMKPEDCMFGKPSDELFCYKLKQKNFSLTESYKIKDQNDKTAFKVKGIFFSL